MKREGYTITDYADYYDFSHKKFSSRCGQKITRIIPHHMAGNMTLAQFNAIMHSSREMSPTVAVFTDGTVCSYVPEELRPWTTGSKQYPHGEADKPALTLEIANDGSANTGWHISDTAYNTAVKIMAEWCNRYGIDPKYTYQGEGINMHRDWASTACPGDYLYKKIISGQLERDIKRAMNPRDKAKLKKFVELLYKHVLGRKADTSGLNYWVNELYNGGSNAALVTRSFFNSQEYIKRKTDNEQFLTDVYYAYLDRKPDEVGFTYWLKQLESGSSRNSILEGFEKSREFETRKKKYTL